MNAPQKMTTAMRLVKADPNSPAFVVTGPTTILIKGGTTFGETVFDADTAVIIDVPLEPGGDYGVSINGGKIGYVRLDAPPVDDDILGGFHFAPGGNALARAGGDAFPAINPYSVWDASFRPACADPRGMARVTTAGGKSFWVDIYLIGVNHVTDGTSRYGVVIADGTTRPKDSNGKKAKSFDYDTALVAMKAHGKGLLSIEERFSAAFGVTEKTASGSDPDVTGLDAPRTSKFGLMQASGNMWEWGHDGDPDEPRPAIFGGAWWGDDSAGSRQASVVGWPGLSHENIGARGRCDHLQPA